MWELTKSFRFEPATALSDNPRSGCRAEVQRPFLRAEVTITARRNPDTA